MPAVTPVLWHYRTNKDGLSPIYLRLADGQKTRYRSLKVSVREGQWNDRACRVSGRHPNAAEINKMIADEVQRAEDEVFRRTAVGERTDADAVARSLTVRPTDDKPGQSDFFSFADELVGGYKTRGQMWTHDRYVSVLKKMRAYTGEPFAFSGLTPAFLRRYEAHLAKEYGNTVNTIATNLSTIKTVIRRAIAEGLMEYGANPFLSHSIRTEPTAPVRFTLTEVRALEALNLPFGTPLRVARDTFLLQFYSGGARFSDVADLRWGSVQSKTISYRASKTKKVVEVPLLPQAETVIAPYRTDSSGPRDHVLPHLAGRDLSTPEARKKAVRSCTTLTNKALKEIATMAEIDKNLTTHVARHSFADHCRTMGLSVYDISKAMRHSSIKMTERYLARLDTGSLGDKMAELFS
ncbi:hypothetical protein B1759_16620 [Rubrivirga sp. SAORIC476]|uniref:site-specific integrase n=1 Tax=Rubrivirga sp. SAORIC476 TaxID=1961794 RepID=UPI000BD1192B|nr:site-specific integrase [Rubrivirga sp. SAORIC476]PAP74801.1 hypothetical protein B1759_16620 [Rubrivirga sp. SAORIC476]